ncbi:SseB family protein [Aliiroseovarius sp. F47248L]|uniref:SseB family protein n=1 Tax=Aliiroseovarius sp. F47248L TaxID=2926420 RepID=UPI001FF58873|nr:SseB family protein [Aliiroseovarius sp. F47248L]MCK0137822.1 SseB family protein [Aliiroseovarius sp. F47248L]
MTETTHLDDAHVAMQANLDDDAARLRFYERLADGELFLLLTEEPNDDEISPDLFELEGATFALVFDREDRLAEFVGTPAPYAALPGRLVANMLAGQNIGLGVNLGIAPSSILIPPDAMSWLADTLKSGPEQVEARIAEVHAPSAPEALISALGVKLASAAGLASYACLAGVTYADGRKGHLLGFVDAATGAEHALAGAANEALTFSGLEAGEMDVGFFASHDQAAGKLAALGIRFDLPKPKPQERLTPVAPGSDPDKPPILK